MTDRFTIDTVPAAHLEGRDLPNGWKVLGRPDRTLEATGGHFSIAYRVVGSAGQHAFLKALNFHAALTGAGDLMDRVEEFASAYRFERDLVKDCTSRRMSRVIQLLDHGEISVPEAGVLSRVPYLIFELADGDLRAFQEKLGRFDAAWVLRSLKHAALGIEQLHMAHTTHQDLKPSNVLTQENGREMKLGDLGRAERRGVDGPVSGNRIPGAVTYAPPEQLYGGFGLTWEERRAGDMYLLGSLAAQLILGHSLTALMQMALPKPFRAGTWNEGFLQVLPYLVTAHVEVMERLRVRASELLGLPELAKDLTLAVGEMTCPDPSRRGHPRDRAARTSSYDVRRYVSSFNRLAVAAELRLRTI